MNTIEVSIKGNENTTENHIRINNYFSIDRNNPIDSRYCFINCPYKNKCAIFAELQKQNILFNKRVSDISRNNMRNTLGIEFT